MIHALLTLTFVICLCTSCFSYPPTSMLDLHYHRACPCSRRCGKGPKAAKRGGGETASRGSTHRFSIKCENTEPNSAFLCHRDSMNSCWCLDVESLLWASRSANFSTLFFPQLQLTSDDLLKASQFALRA